jgi:hypothetical protein
MLVEAWHSNSASLTTLRDEKEVGVIRGERKAAQEKQQSVDNAAPLADAAQKMSGAVDPTSIVANMEE